MVLSVHVAQSLGLSSDAGLELQMPARRTTASSFSNGNTCLGAARGELWHTHNLHRSSRSMLAQRTSSSFILPAAGESADHLSPEQEARKVELEAGIKNQREAVKTLRGAVGKSIGDEAAADTKGGEGYDPHSAAQEKAREGMLHQQLHQEVKTADWENALEEHKRMLQELQSMKPCGSKERVPMASLEEESPKTEPYGDPVLATNAGVVGPPATLPPDVPDTCRPGPEVLEDLSATVWAPQGPSVSSRTPLKMVLPPTPLPSELESGHGPEQDDASGPMGDAELIGESGVPALSLYMAALGPRSSPAATVAHCRMQRCWQPSVGKVFL